MRHAKTGQFWEHSPHRMLANNSVVYNEKPDAATFLTEWLSLIRSGSGERGIFNRESAKFIVANSGRRDPNWAFGCNPSLRKGTRVWTTDGVVPIEELENKTFKVRNLNGKISDAKCWLSGRDQVLYELTLQGGHKYYATKEHEWPVLVNGEYVKTKTPDIVAGSYLPIIPNETATQLTNGTLGTQDDGFLIGWNLGDGWITQRKNGKTQYGFIVSDSDRDSKIDQKISTTLKKYSWTGDLSNKNEINVVNESVTNLFKQHGVTHKRDGLPTSVWKDASEEFRKGLIDGIFSSDGSIDTNRNRCRITLTSAHEKLVNDVSDLLGFYGIKSCVSKTVRSVSFTNRPEKEYTIFTLRINDFNSIKIFNSLFTLTHMNKQSKIVDRLKSETKTNNIGKIKVVSVKETTLKEDVWDISVSDTTHCFQLAHCITGNCSEIILRPNSTCNLSEVIIRPEDTLDVLKKKVKYATILGCIQSTLTNFNFLNRNWKKNAEEERLLGVSLTGLRDHPVLNRKSRDAQMWLTDMKQTAIDIAKEWSAALEIAMPAAITCVKPSGSVSALADTASGLHPRYSPYYIRRVRVSSLDPICKYLMDRGVPSNPEVGQSEELCSTRVFEFPLKSPETAIMRDDVTALEQLEYWKMIQKYWCEHKPSITIYVKNDEWVSVGNWVYENWNYISGVSFLPYDGGVYRLSPFEEISEDTYHELVSKFPELDFNELQNYEKEDETSGAKELACTGGSCELI